MSTLVEPSKPSTDQGDDLDHYYCCDENVAHCGADLTDVPITAELPNLCVVCDDIDRACEADAHVYTCRYYP